MQAYSDLRRVMSLGGRGSWASHLAHRHPAGVGPRRRLHVLSYAGRPVAHVERVGRAYKVTVMDTYWIGDRFLNRAGFSKLHVSVVKGSLAVAKRIAAREARKHGK